MDKLLEIYITMRSVGVMKLCFSPYTPLSH